MRKGTLRPSGQLHRKADLSHLYYIQLSYIYIKLTELTDMIINSHKVQNHSAIAQGAFGHRAKLVKRYNTVFRVNSNSLKMNACNHNLNTFTKLRECPFVITQ